MELTKRQRFIDDLREALIAEDKAVSVTILSDESEKEETEILSLFDSETRLQLSCFAITSDDDLLLTEQDNFLQILDWELVQYKDTTKEAE